MEEKEVKKFLNNSNYRHVKKRRSVLKEELVKYKGGKCEICGYNKCIEALEFHHLNREEKDFTISSYGVSDNAVRKWFKHYGLPYNKKELMEYIKSNK